MPSVLTFDQLMEAARKCSRGVKWKDSIATWVHPRNIALNCLKLKRDLDSGKYRLGGYVTFEVTEPKRRVIRSPKFRDRVVQRAMCANGLYEDLTRGSIHDNAACQIGKGTTFAMDRLDCHMQRFWRRHGLDGWVLRLDIHKFFDSIPHAQLKEMIRRKIRQPEFQERVIEVVDSFGDPGIGLGSQVSQLLAIAYLSDMDHAIKEEMGFRHYVRYSDDMVIIHQDRQVLMDAWRRIREILASLGLSLNPKSTIHLLRHGIKFLKFRFLLTGTGKVVRILDRANTARMRKRLKKLVRMEKNGRRSRQDVMNCFTSWKSHAEQGNSHTKIRRMKKWTIQES